MTKPSTLAALILVPCLLAEAKGPNRLTTTWLGLAAASEGRTLTISSKNGKKIKGRLINADPDGITLDAGKSGSVTMARSEIARVRASRKQPGYKGRAIGAGIGAGFAAFVIWAVSVLHRNEGGNFQPWAYPVIAAYIAGPFAAAYFIGRAIDRAPVDLEITDLAR